MSARTLYAGLLAVALALWAGCGCKGASNMAQTGAPPLPPEPTAECPHVPLGGFYDVWRNEQVRPRLGCAVAAAEKVDGTEVYLCDGTHTLWLRQQHQFVAIPVWPRPWRFVADSSGLPDDAPLMEGPEQRPTPCFPASGRHGWVARQLGRDVEPGAWARTDETPFGGAIQSFQGGWLLWNGNVCFVLFADSTWTMF